MTRLPVWVRQHLAAVRALIVLTVLLGIAYPAIVTGIAQLPGLHGRADGSPITIAGQQRGSSLIGQEFTDAHGAPIAKYFQSRPSAAGTGYDPTASGASNLGPEDIVDQPGKPSLLSQVCARSAAVGRLEGVDGRRPYCTADGVGAVLSVIRAAGPGTPVLRVISVNQACPARPFVNSYDDVLVSCTKAGDGAASGELVPVRGPGLAWPANPVPPDAVTASGSGLDPDISTAYAHLQVARVARARNLPTATVDAAVAKATTGRTLGFMGEPAVDVVALNAALDRLQS